MALAVAGSLSSCGDKKEDPLPNLIPAMVTVASSDQVQDLLGDATSKDITVDANRELKITVPAAATWLTATVKSDLTAGKATLTIAVTDNETAFKGRKADILIECLSSRSDDNVSGVSAKATISVSQSLKGLAVADLFDLKLNADGTAEDVSGTFKWGDKVAYYTNTDPAVTMSGGPIKPVVAMNPQYGRLEATFSGIQSEDYTRKYKPGPNIILASALGWDTQYGTLYYEEYNFEKMEGDVANPDAKKYDSWDGTAPNTRNQGNTKLCFYKMHYGGKMYDGAGRIEKVNTALQNAYSYEVLVRWPYDVGETVVPAAEDGSGGIVYSNNDHGYVFGNSVSRDDRGGAAIRGRGGKLCFSFALNWGGGARAHLDSLHTETESGFDVVAGDHPDAATGVKIKKDVVYHLVATYSKEEGKIAFYVDGKLLVSTTDNRLKTSPPSFPTQYYAHGGGNIQGEDNFPVGNVHVPNVEYFVIPGGANANMPTNGGDMQGHNIKFMVARVYGKALTQEEVTASYNYFKPE
jgi:hypothetical protein